MAAVDVVGHHSYSIVNITGVKKSHAEYIHGIQREKILISKTDHCTIIYITILY